MNQNRIVDTASVIFFIAVFAVSFLISYQLTKEPGYSAMLGALCGLMFWCAYLTIRWIYLSLKR